MAPGTATHRQTESAARSPPLGRDYRGEQLTLRNHDASSGYGLTVVVSDPAGPVRARSRFVVGSGTTTRVYDLCEPGEVTVEVRHAGEAVGTVRTELDETPAGTVVVECGNGVVTAASGPA